MKGRLGAIVSEHRRPLVAYLLTAVTQSIVGMMTIVLFQRLIDALRGNSPAPSFTSTLGIYVALTAANHLLIYAQEYPQRLLAVGIYYSVKRAAMRRLARIDYSAYTELDTGSTLQIVENGADAAGSILTGFWFFLAVTALTLPVQLYLIPGLLT